MRRSSGGIKEGRLTGERLAVEVEGEGKQVLQGKAGHLGQPVHIVRGYGHDERRGEAPGLGPQNGLTYLAFSGTPIAGQALAIVRGTRAIPGDA